MLTNKGEWKTLKNKYLQSGEWCGAPTKQREKAIMSGHKEKKESGQ